MGAAASQDAELIKFCLRNEIAAGPSQRASGAVSSCQLAAKGPDRVDSFARDYGIMSALEDHERETCRDKFNSCAIPAIRNAIGCIFLEDFGLRSEVDESKWIIAGSIPNDRWGQGTLHAGTTFINFVTNLQKQVDETDMDVSLKGDSNERGRCRFKLAYKRTYKLRDMCPNRSIVLANGHFMVVKEVQTSERKLVCWKSPGNTEVEVAEIGTSLRFDVGFLVDVQSVRVSWSASSGSYVEVPRQRLAPFAAEVSCDGMCARSSEAQKRRDEEREAGLGKKVQPRTPPKCVAQDSVFTSMSLSPRTVTSSSTPASGPPVQNANTRVDIDAVALFLAGEEQTSTIQPCADSLDKYVEAPGMKSDDESTTASAVCSEEPLAPLPSAVCATLSQRSEVAVSGHKMLACTVANLTSTRAHLGDRTHCLSAVEEEPNYNYETPEGSICVVVSLQMRPAPDAFFPNRRALHPAGCRLLAQQPQGDDGPVNQGQRALQSYVDGAWQSTKKDSGSADSNGVSIDFSTASASF